MIVFKEQPDVFFDAFEHKYQNANGDIYTSVTQLIEQYKKPFDKMYWAKKKALERGVTADVILDEWAGITRLACHNGNVIHDKLDAGIGGESYRSSEKNFVKVIQNNEQGTTLLSDSLKQEFPEIAKVLQKYIDNGYRVYSEKRVFLHDYKVAGTIDCPLIKDDEFEIFDWKTNKDGIPFKAGYYKKINGIKTNQFIETDTRLLYPVEDLQESKGNMYTLQLSLYAYMLETLGYKCKGLKLFHILNGQITLCVIPYLRSHVEKLLVAHSTKTTSSTFSLNII